MLMFKNMTYDKPLRLEGRYTNLNAAKQVCMHERTISSGMAPHTEDIFNPYITKLHQ